MIGDKISEKEKHKKPIDGLEGDITKPHLRKFHEVKNLNDGKKTKQQPERLR